MRIDLNGSFLRNESAQSIQSGAPATEATAKSVAMDDTAELSSHYLSVGALTSAVGQLPEIRQERVATLAEKLRAGSYEVSPQQIAEAMGSQMALNSAA